MGESGSVSLSMSCAQVNRSGRADTMPSNGEKEKNNNHTDQKGSTASLGLIGRGSSLCPPKVTQLQPPLCRGSACTFVWSCDAHGELSVLHQWSVS